MDKGVVVEKVTDGRVFAHKAAGRSIDAIAPLDVEERTFILGGAKRQLRILEIT